MDPKPPKIVPPPLACDTHAHIFGPVALYPLAPERDWTPPDRPLEAYADMLDTLGLARGVIVHSSSHGTDNRVTLDAIARMRGRCVGICLVSASVSDRELQDLAAGGMRGIRVSTMLKGSIGIQHLEAMSPRLKALGWQVVLHFDKPEEIVPVAPMLRRLPVPVVFDHMGRVRGNTGKDSPAFQSLLALVRETDHCWVKICSWYRLSDQGPPYDDMRPYVEALIRTRADRLLWGSNWPHPLLKGPPPDDAELLDQFQRWAGSERKTILVDNPAKLYGFKEEV